MDETSNNDPTQPIEPATQADPSHLTVPLEGSWSQTWLSPQAPGPVWVEDPGSTSSGRLLPGAADPRHGLARYLGPNEHVICASRRHVVVLDAAIGLWVTATLVGLGAALFSQRYPGLALLGVLAFLTGTAFLACRAWAWWCARYVFTNNRVLLVEGILAHRVHGLPLRAVLDTTYHRSLGGRLRGYGDLELNLSGQPGLRKLTCLPHPDSMYQLVLSLMQQAA